jgi:hemoglobin
MVPACRGPLSLVLPATRPIGRRFTRSRLNGLGATRDRPCDSGRAAGGCNRSAARHRAWCLADPVLAHPFEHPGDPDHVQHLADYWAEVLGGPATFSQRYGGHSAMLELHARMGAEPDLGQRFVTCFVEAADDAGLPADPELRAALRSYMEWATAEVMAYQDADSVVPSGRATPRWSWDGLQTTDQPA